MINSTLRVHLFGPARVHNGQQAIADFPTAKARLLFYYLLLFHANEHPRSILQGLFWGDRPEERANHSLRTELWRLRQWLKSLPGTTVPELVIQDSQVRFRLEDRCWLDTYEFEKSIKQANRLQAAAPDQAALALRQAVDLYDGVLMEGFYEDWCLIERERLQHLFVDTLARLMLYHGSHREYTQAIQYGQRILNEEPLREDIHRELIKLYANNQQMSLAIAQYHACETILDRDLHITPQPETQDIFRGLITGQRGLPQPTPIVLKADPSTKEQEIQVLTRRVQHALEQLEATRRELNETLLQMEQMRHKSGDRRPTQPL